MINFLIIFFIFKKFLGDKILNEITERRELYAKLKNLEAECERIEKDAKEKAAQIVHEGVEHKNAIIQDAKTLAQQQQDTIVQEAQRRAAAIVDQAQVEAQNMKSDLTSEWEQSVKSTTKMVVDKLLGTNTDLQQQYLDTLIKEAAQK
jgi:F0F1-type ATP synthase membrane subunit b/b'